MLAKKSKKDLCVDVIDYTLLVLIGCVCYLYAIMSTTFAEIHIQLPFLNFPLFVGELLFGTCLILYLIKKMLMQDWRWTKWNILLTAYIIFVMVKWLMGYVQYGPLACRHAAMFFYPLFGVITYSIFCVERRYRLLKVGTLFLIIISFLLFDIAFHQFPFIALGLSISLTFKNRKMRYFFLAIVLLLSPFKGLFIGARTIIVASSLAGIFVISMLSFMIKGRYKYIAFFVGVAFLGYGFFAFTPGKIRKSITSIGDVAKMIQQSEEFIKDKEATYIPKEITAQLYNPNSESRGRLENFPEKTLEKLDNKTIDNLARMIKIGEYLDPPQAKKKSGNISKGEYQATIEEQRAGNVVHKWGTIAFRYNIMRDMLEQMWQYKPIFGFSLGKPFRSRRLEITRNAWGEWTRDGWIISHNSILEVIYRFGIIGIFLISLLMWEIARLSCGFLERKSLVGILMVGIIIFWVVSGLSANIFEMPYYAIPLWSLFGVTIAYSRQIKRVDQT